MSVPFPFSAIVGQDEMKQAIILTAIDPKIGGVLIFGDRGTGKSTAIRALAAMMPRIRVVAGCPYNAASLADRPDFADPLPDRLVDVPTPVVDLPLGVSEDRVLGALDIERALTQGQKAFEPGLLARAHRGYLYIDEVNLLEDHIVDLLLDVAASGVNLIEREGLSLQHPADFILMGSGNPEEGELRPQLLDRFGLSVEVETPREVADRIEILERREAFDTDRPAFLKRWRAADTRLRNRILKAREALHDVTMARPIKEDTAALCIALGADGLRGELTLMRAAKAHAALDRRTEVTRNDLAMVAPLCLRHRLRKDPLDDAGSGARVANAVAEVLG
ncbi:MAG: magnesium chelatase ATPase subunit I [Pseudomonadota bacterium]